MEAVAALQWAADKTEETVEGKEGKGGKAETMEELRRERDEARSEGAVAQVRSGGVRWWRGAEVERYSAQVESV